ncbi:MAG: tetratricopeptide repeat protein [Myxococcota bacterium]
MLVLAVGGCATTDEHSPDVRLSAIVETWRDQQAAGIGCQDGYEAQRPVVDCRRLMKALERLALDFPRHPDILFAAATLAREDGMPDKAQSYLAALSLVRPIHPEAGILRARIAMDQGNLPLAERALREQIELAPDHSGLREVFASVAYLRGDFDVATRRLRAAERLGAPDWRIAYHRGLVAEAQGRTDEASAHYRRSIDANPGFARARSRLAGLVVGPAAD